jgi:hypothetical protein
VALVSSEGAELNLSLRQMAGYGYVRVSRLKDSCACAEYVCLCASMSAFALQIRRCSIGGNPVSGMVLSLRNVLEQSSSMSTYVMIAECLWDPLRDPPPCQPFCTCANAPSPYPLHNACYHPSFSPNLCALHSPVSTSSSPASSSNSPV